MGNYYFSTKDLAVGYGGKALIHDINISVKGGEIMTLIGPNGSGKSTILRSVTKHLETIGGDSFIADASISNMNYKELSKKLAVVLTDRIKGELLTCYDVVATGRYPYTNNLGMLSERDREKVIDSMHKVQAEELIDKDFTAISDGQRQRVLLARAICQEPEIIVLDEPTSFLDIRHKLELLSLLRNMAKKSGITVIMSLHEIDLAQKISDKIMCVNGEEIQYFGRPDEIFTDEIIGELYGVKKGSYNILFGSVEMPAPKGEPDIFVISGAGKGISTFRKLQKMDIPFACGILYENDIDFQVASKLSDNLVVADAFKPLCESDFEKAIKLMSRCSRVVNAGFPICEGTNLLNRLVEQAKADDKLVTLEDIEYGIINR